VRETLAVLFLLLPLFLYAQEKKVKILPVPSIGYTPETETYIGAVALFTFDLFGDSLSRTSNAKIELLYTFREQFIADMGWNFFTRDEIWFTQGRLRLSEYPDFYFGLGAGATEEDRVSYSSLRAETEISLSRKLLGNWYLGAGFRSGSYSNIELNEPKTYEFGNSDPFLGLIVQGFQDFRKNLLNPKSGHYLLLRYSLNSTGGEYYGRFDLDLRKYLTAGKTILAFRGNLQYGGEAAPFFDIPAMGGDFHARGYFFGRFRENTIATLQTEIRRPIWRRWGLAAFGGITQVGGFAKNAYKPNLGAGIRFKIDREGDINLRLDYAVGLNGQTGFYIAFGESF
jgi:hypothetical protein